MLYVIDIFSYQTIKGHAGKIPFIANGPVIPNDIHILEKEIRIIFIVMFT